MTGQVSAWLVDLAAILLTMVGCPADRPCYEELADLVARQADRIDQLEAEVAELRRQLGAEQPQRVEAAVAGLAVYQARSEMAGFGETTPARGRQAAPGCIAPVPASTPRSPNHSKRATPGLTWHLREGP